MTGARVLATIAAVPVAFAAGVALAAHRAGALRAATHAFRGRPVAYGLRFGAPVSITGPSSGHILVSGCVFSHGVSVRRGGHR